MLSIVWQCSGLILVVCSAVNDKFDGHNLDCVYEIKRYIQATSKDALIFHGIGKKVSQPATAKAAMLREMPAGGH